MPVISDWKQGGRPGSFWETHRGLLAGGGGIAAWTPADLFVGGFTGCWLDFSDLTKVWQDSGGTTPGVVDSPIGLIQAKGGTGHFSQGTSGARPALKSSGGLYWAENDGIDDAMAAASALIPASPPFTVMFAARFASGTLGAILAQYASAQTGRAGWVANQSDNGAQGNGAMNPFINGITNGAGFGNVAASQSSGNNTAFVHTFVAESGSEASRHYLNGTEVDRFTVASVYTGANTRILGETTLGFTTVKRLYQLLIIDKALSDAERLSTRTFFAAKSGAPAP